MSKAASNSVSFFCQVLDFSMNLLWSKTTH